MKVQYHRLNFIVRVQTHTHKHYNLHHTLQLHSELQLRTRMNIHVPGQGAKVQGQFQTDCKKAQEAALLCATTHPEERQRCDKFFAAYRECRKAEHSRILEARGQGR